MLIKFVKKRKLHLIKDLFDYDVVIDKTDLKRRTALIYACKKNY